MDHQDPELEQLRAGVRCAVLLERNRFRLDRMESTRRSQKWRRSKGESLIVNHDGRGWWDPHRPAGDALGKGDVFTLAQRFNPELTFGQVRKLLHGLLGVPSSEPIHQPDRPSDNAPAVPVAERWQRRRRLRPGSSTWAYLTRQRGLPPSVLHRADRHDAVREGPKASAWFAHRDQAGAITGIDMRGPDWRGFSAESDKTLFRLPGGEGALTRLAVCEAPIDALSWAALETLRGDTLYAATTGGMGPRTLACLIALLADLAGRPGGVLAIGTDDDRQGERYAKQLAELAAAADVASERVMPPGGHTDWNDALMHTRAARPCPGRDSGG